MNGAMTRTTSWMMTSRKTGDENLGFRPENLGCAEPAIPDSIPGLSPGVTGRKNCGIVPAGNSGR